MKDKCRQILIAALLLVTVTSSLNRSARAQDPAVTSRLNGITLSVAQVTESELKDAEASGVNAIVLPLQYRTPVERAAAVTAAERILGSGLALCYWIEIAHCPELADDHPEWMASLQGHQEWRRLFPDAPRPKKDVEVIKNYPWVPILSEEAFAAHHQRVKRLLSGMPEADSIFVNDLQGGPSACGCGNTLCRWTADYGPIKTATPLGADAAARFVETISKLAPNSEVIPVWLTECEEHDGADDGLCAGVGCFRGICWKAWTDQLMPVAENSATIAAFLPFRELQRDISLYGDTAAWIPFALGTFRTMPLQHQKAPVAAGRLIAVLQGWDVSPAEIEAQKRQVQRAGAAGCVVVRDRIDQSWQPRLYRLPQ